MTSQEIFARRLENTRKMRNLQQAELAKKAGLQPSAISHFETGTRKPSFDNLRRLAQALDVTVDYLMGRTDEPGGMPGDDALYRDIQKLTAENRELAEQFIATLASRRQKKEGNEK